MKPVSEEICHALIACARRAGADAADAVVASGSSVSVDTRAGALEHAERSETTDMGLRVLVGQRQAIVSASNLSTDAMSDMAERAVVMAQSAPDDPFAGLADPADLAKSWDLAGLELNDPTAEPDPKTLESDALRAEAAAMAVDGVSQIDTASASFGRQQVFLATSTGFAGGYTRSSRSIYCVAIAGEGTGMERDYDGETRIFQADLPDPEQIGTSAGSRAISRLNARKPQTGSFPVLYDERVAASLIGSLLAAVNGAAVARGSSWLKDALGEQVLPASLSLIEDPHRPRLGGSRPFDGEGLPTRRRAIIENGALTGWTMDLASARKLGMSPTGNAARGPSSLPSPANWNIALTQGPDSRAKLLQDMGTGLLVTSMIGSTINPNTGDYSRGASGFWIEGGEIAYPVNECTIAGNLRDMLLRIIPANDARSWLSRSVPSLLVEGMTVAGN